MNKKGIREHKYFEYGDFVLDINDFVCYKKIFDADGVSRQMRTSFIINNYDNEFTINNFEDDESINKDAIEYMLKLVKKYFEDSLLM